MLKILSNYFPNPTHFKAIPVGDGYINDTYRLLNSNGTDYLLQRINHEVFTDVPGLMNNLVSVTDFIKNKLTADTQYTDCLTVIPTIDERYFVKLENGQYWRILNFFDNYISHNIPDTDVGIASQQIYSAAHAFGNFLYQLREFPVAQLSIVLPDFHHVPKRLIQLKHAISINTNNRVTELRKELEFIEKWKPEMCRIQKLIDQKKIPVRVTHNDTKFNNVLFDKNGKARVVIDLDTVMPGCVHYDYGDGLRTTATTAAEDEKDLNLVQVEPERYTAFQEGYLSGTADLLHPLEKATLSLAAPTLAYIMAVRFLTDYLLGDVYYKIAYPKQNLNRGKAQLRLTEQFLLMKI